MPLLAIALTSLLATAGSTPASAPAKAPAPSDIESCDRPTDPQDKGSDPEPLLTPEQKAAEAAYKGYQHSLALSLRTSDSPRERAMSTQMWVLGDSVDALNPTPVDAAVRGARLRAAAESAPDDPLVQWLWAEAAPEESGCSSSNPCPNRTNSLARLQPDNGSAWLPVFRAAWDAKDVPAAEAALANMTLATHFDEQIGTSMSAWMAIYQRHPAPRSAFVPGSPESQVDERTIGFVNALAVAAATTIPSYQAPIEACHRDRHPEASTQRFLDCAQVGRVMLTHSNSLIDRQIGKVLLRVSGQATAEDVANARIAQWQFEQWPKLVDDRPGHEFDDTMATAADWQETGDEIQVLQRQMQRRGIPLTPPANWQPLGHDGKPASPLGEDPTRSK